MRSSLFRPGRSRLLRPLLLLGALSAAGSLPVTSRLTPAASQRLIIQLSKEHSSDSGPLCLHWPFEATASGIARQLNGIKKGSTESLSTPPLTEACSASRRGQLAGPTSRPAASAVANQCPRLQMRASKHARAKAPTDTPYRRAQRARALTRNHKFAHACTNASVRSDTKIARARLRTPL